MRDGFTAEDRAAILSLLEESLHRCEKAFLSVPEALWDRRPSPGEWSPAEVAEHIVVTENVLLNRLTNELPHSAVTPMTEERARLDEVILRMVPQRDPKRRFQAPELIQPTGRYATRTALIDALREVRRGVIDFARTTEFPLRNHILKHPAFGETDGYQWLLFVPAHADRHLAQMREHTAKLTAASA